MASLTTNWRCSTRAPDVLPWSSCSTRCQHCLRPGSARVATGADDGYARIFSIADGREVARLPLGEKVQHLEFERDGRLKATVYTFDSYLWESYFRYALAPTMARDLIAAACKRLTRNLTADEWSNYVGGTYRETCPELSALAARNSGTIRTR